MASEGGRDGMFVNNGTLRRVKDFGNIQIDDALFVIGHDAFSSLSRWSKAIGMFDKRILIAILLFRKEPLLSVRIIIGGKCREKS